MKLKTSSATRVLHKDPVLKKAIKGLDPLSLPGAGNVFNELVKAIAYQQISYKAADTIFGRFVNLLGSENYTPKKLLAVSFDEMRAIGFSKQKANYSHNIARYFKENKLYKTDWSNYSDKEIMDMLTTIKGVGEWTAEMVMLFELMRPDIFPAKDLAIQQSMMTLYGFELEKKALLSKMKEIAEAWRPHRSLATLYLWSWKRANP